MEVLSLKRIVIQIQDQLVNEKWVRYQHHLPDIQFEINNYLNCEKNQVQLGNAEPGIICALKSKECSFERAVILNTRKLR